jgi:hypothetical protein
MFFWTIQTIVATRVTNADALATGDEANVRTGLTLVPITDVIIVVAAF